MDALVMAGGEGSRLVGGDGSRLDDREKPLVRVGGATMIERVLDALARSDVDDVYTAVSPNAPKTAGLLERNPDVRTVDTRGAGYVEDLGRALEAAGIDLPALTVVADLPLLSSAAVDRVRSRAGSDRSTTVAVPVAMKRRLDASVETTLPDRPHLAPTGVNVVSSTAPSSTVVSYDPGLAINVNHPRDHRVAEALVHSRSRGVEVSRDGS